MLITKTLWCIQMLAVLVTLKVHMTWLVTTALVYSQELIIQMTSLKCHFCTPRTGMHNLNQCSTSCLKCQFTPLAFCQFIICMGCYNHMYLHVIMDTLDAYMGWSVLSSTWLHAYQLYFALTCMYNYTTIIDYYVVHHA